MLSSIEYRVLKLISPLAKDRMTGSAYVGKSKVRTLLGDKTVEDMKGQVVIDFGCGLGHEAVELALAGAKKVIGIDIRPWILDEARAAASRAGVASRCEFSTTIDERADCVVSLDSFEHFSEPDAMLQKMFDLLKAGGLLAASFGPTWYHPLGGHFFSFPFPWSHLLFTERALIRWREEIKHDGIKKFCEVDGGLNQMTIGRFERIARRSPFEIESIEAVPIRKLKFLHNRWTREFTTAVVRCRLRRPSLEPGIPGFSQGARM